MKCSTSWMASNIFSPKQNGGGILVGGPGLTGQEFGILGFKKLFGAFHARCRLGDVDLPEMFKVDVDIPTPPKKKPYYMMKGETLLKETSCWVIILS